jgi:hypothetical protein
MTREPLAELKLRRPRYLTKHGYSKEPRGDNPSGFAMGKYCNMSRLHEDNTRRFGLSVSEKSGTDAGIAAMSQVLPRR